MKTYKVTLSFYKTVTVEVEANNEDTAIEKARDDADYQLDPDVTVEVIGDDKEEPEIILPETISDEYEMGLLNQSPMDGQISLLEVAS